MRQLAKEFKARGPWVTQFMIDGRLYGGHYHAATDARLATFFALYPKPGRVLELGSLEGGHTFPIARVADSVVALESRLANLTRARWLQERFGLSNITFQQANLESFDLRNLGTFDVVFNLGLLYHLPEPWWLVERLGQVAREMFLWTHVANPNGPIVKRAGYAGASYGEFGLADPLSGMSETSFWPLEEELERMLVEAGFDQVDKCDKEASHPHGPAILWRCRATRPLALTPSAAVPVVGAAAGKNPSLTT